MVSSARSSLPSVGSGDSASSVFGGVSQEKTNGTRLARLLIDEGTSSLQRFLLFSIHPETLEDVLKTNLPKLLGLKSRRVILGDQWEKLFPGSGHPPNIAKFDITLLHLLIREFSNLPPPAGGWHKLPAKNDASIQANIARIKYFRNELCYNPSTAITESEFEHKWNQISSALETVVVYIQRHKILRLKNDPIDHINEWRRLQQLQQQENDEPSSCLPDAVPEVFGRSKEIHEVKQYLQSGTDAVVLITGGPGFGKTAVARETAHKLKENEHTVLFCSLLKKTTFPEAATEMIHSCGKIVGQLSENPEYWLKDWSKQIQSQVVFVLDNADGLLESEANRDKFLETLSAMTMLSNKNLAFVITSRKRVQQKSLPWKEVNLSPLSPDEAKKLLISRVRGTETQIEKNSKVETIVELCGCVPLALSIVGSLLSDYPEERIIKHLEKEPMSILKDGDESFQKAIMNSFDLLTKPERDALVAVSIFPGSFDCDAAEAVLKGTLGPETTPITTLRSLNNRSLVVVEQAGSHRYQMHSLIRAFAKKIGETENPQVLLHSRELACAHFISRLEENTRLYWGKDTCKEAIESFSADRQNFEHFLKVFANGLEAQEIATSCKKFLDSLSQAFEYFGKCISPKLYIEILGLLLRSKYFQAKSQPVHRVELLCLLGQEMRRLGDKTKYKDLMEEAHRLFSAHVGEFETKFLSRVFYFQSRARFLSEANKFHDPEPKILYDKALKICEEKLPGHPETAVNLLLAGRNAKRCKMNAEANEKFQRALSLFQNLLGDHFMTAQCLKDSADFVFLAKQSDQGLDKALNYYGKAVRVMEKLGTHEHKESILTLKNYASCHMKKGNFEEAEKLLLKAELVCERELEKDHTWKVMVKTQLGLLYHEMADKQENKASVTEGLLTKMEASMKVGLDMSFRLNKSINDLGNRKLIRKVLTSYPERFPEDLYPRDEKENDEPSSCLPDEVPEVFGRSKEIDEVKQYLQSGTDAVVLITGGPGFGKTTVARETAHKLKENGHTVLFCSLLKKTTFLEAATEVILSCGKIVGQLPENPEYWLKNWSKQIQSQVVFVLDNADSLLESETDRDLLLETLSAMRMFSKQNVAFVITSRKRFQPKSLPWKQVNLSPLSPDEAKQLLISRVSRTGTQIEEFSEVETIVELCGCVPLALSIVGPLLSDYPEERIIKYLEKEPMTILEDGDDESFQKAIMNSFDLLTKTEKHALIALSIFPGSFDYNAAEAVLKGTLGPETTPITTLRSLNNRSLVVVEQAGSHRYQMHSLIHAFAKKIGETENPQVLLPSRELACEHFISRLEENTRLYWGKDTCKEAIESFSADRQNFEYFLQDFANGLTAQEIATSREKFFDSLFQTFEYLEKCISSKVYIEILELLLRSKYFQAEYQPVHRVELLCLLGQEMRRLGDKTKYKGHMEEADLLFTSHVDEFQTKTLSHVFYLHNRARFLSQANKPFDLDPKRLYDEALEICEKNLPDHPETAVNLLLAGRNAKRRKKNPEASKKFQRAFSLFNKLLGDHFMTAQCLKDFADFVFFAEQSDQGLDKALQYYGKAMRVMEKLGTHEQKESILTLKNYGGCLMKKGNFEEAEKLLLKAELVCERELENADHTWKVMVKTHLGLLYHEMVDKQENEASVREGLVTKMETSMKEGLDMCYRLNHGQKSINHLGNKAFIRNVLTSYPERFPKDLYPTL